MSKTNRFNELRAQSSVGTRYLWFYTRILLVLQMIWTGINLFLSYPEFMILVQGGDYSTAYKINIAVSFVYGIACFVLVLNAHYGLLNGSANGYKINLVYLWVLLGGNVLLLLIGSTFDFVTRAAATLGSAIFLVPNLIYFKKRRRLFVTADEPSPSSPIGESND